MCERYKYILYRQLTENKIHTIERDSFRDLTALERL